MIKFVLFMFYKNHLRSNKDFNHPLYVTRCIDTLLDSGINIMDLIRTSLTSRLFNFSNLNVIKETLKKLFVKFFFYR